GGKGGTGGRGGSSTGGGGGSGGGGSGGTGTTGGGATGAGGGGGAGAVGPAADSDPDGPPVGRETRLVPFEATEPLSFVRWADTAVVRWRADACFGAVAW